MPDPTQNPTPSKKLVYLVMPACSVNGRLTLQGKGADSNCIPELQCTSVEALVRHHYGRWPHTGEGVYLVIEYEVDQTSVTRYGAELLKFRRLVGHIPAGPSTPAEALAAFRRRDDLTPVEALARTIEALLAFG